MEQDVEKYHGKPRSGVAELLDDPLKDASGIYQDII
jgi:hypothetical protein